MKGTRGGFRPIRREQLLQERVHDTYKERGKPVQPAHCPECSAVFRKGRWMWDEDSGKAASQTCPACQRIRDRFPAGYVKLNGKFLEAHRGEILRLVRGCEKKEKTEHPMQRIMEIKNLGESVLVTTTDVHLARNIAERIHHAYQGRLSFRYNKEEMLLRASWTR